MTGRTRDYKSYELEQESTEIMRENRIRQIIGSDWNAAGEGVWKAGKLERFNRGKRASSSIQIQKSDSERRRSH